MRERLRAKLRSKAGESLGETLLALLISAMALTMLAGAISTAAKLVNKSNTQMASYYGADNFIAAQSGTPTAKNKQTTKNSVSIVEKEGSAPITQSFSETVSFFENDAFTTIPVVSYKST